MNNNLLSIENIKKYLQERKVYWTKHCLNRLSQRNILIKDVKTAIANGRILEYYYEDYPFPSCLIQGYSLSNKILHIICGMSDNKVYMITAYYPDSDRWEEDMKTRRKK